MTFEVEVHRTERGDWVAEAVAYGVRATGRTEQEALAGLMDALALHFKRQGRSAAGP
jgi:predicted RNase H-like HicB family nuclease